MIINEIFPSISGEVCSFGQGRTCAFIRMAGCNLTCSYCDTPETQNAKNGAEWGLDQIVRTLKTIGAKQFVITGGEPMQQAEELKKLLQLLWRHFSQGRELHEFVAIETNGSLPVLTMKPRFSPCWVVDYKLGVPEKMNIETHKSLGPDDFIKFVINSYSDMRRAFELQMELKECTTARFAYSIIFDYAENAWMVRPNDLLNKAQKLGLDITVNLQIHKFLGVA